MDLITRQEPCTHDQQPLTNLRCNAKTAAAAAALVKLVKFALLKLFL